MDITVEWDKNDPRVVITTYAGRWTWDDFYAARARLNEMIDRVDHDVSMIVDYRQNVWLPAGISEQVDNVMSNIHLHVNVIVVLGQEINRELHSLLEKAHPEITRIYVYANSEAEARAIIQRRHARKPRFGWIPCVGHHN